MTILAFVLCVSVVLAESPPEPRPNIVILVADDLGYADLGCQGCEDVPTPNIDAIASDGIRFTAGYATCSVCAPTRAALLLGRYQQRFGFEHNPSVPAPAGFGLPADVTTLPERFKTAGYVTAAIGKWHLGSAEGTRPTDRGFDEFFGFLGGEHNYRFPPSLLGVDPLLRGNDPVEEKEYTTRAFAREAVKFIKKNSDVPFFLYCPFNAVHLPLQADPTNLARVTHIEDPERRKFASMLISLDDAVGKIRTAISSSGLEEKTLVVFVSDNGGSTVETTSSNSPLRGQKGSVFEGGIRIPYIISWKGHIPAGVVYGKAVSTMDIHATALAAAGVPRPKEPKLDGVNLLPFVNGTIDRDPHAGLFWRKGVQSAARIGNWKLVRVTGIPDALFDLEEDMSETTNVAASHPDTVSELRDAYDDWESEMIPAKWK